MYSSTKRTRMHEKATMINKKPMDVPIPFANEFKNDKPWSVLL